MKTSTIQWGLVAAMVLAIPLGPAWAETRDAQRQFERAYFLETHEGDLQAAADLYASVAKSRGVPKEMAAEARLRRGSCLEDIRSADLAALMPADTVAFVEVRQPGRHLENLLSMLGLVGDPLSNLTSGETAARAMPIPDAPGLVLPPKVFLSPAIIDQAKQFRGVALAITGMEPPPMGLPEMAGIQGLLVLHPGDAHALRGLIETGAQFVAPADPISGFATLSIQPGLVVTFTHRLVVVGTSRDLVSGVVDHLAGSTRDSLADRPDMAALAEQRGDALVFAFVDAKGAVEMAYKNLGHDRDAMQALGMAQGLFDIGHLQSVSAAIGSTDRGLYAEAAMALDEGHANLIYNLIRTPPMSGRSLQNVPAGAAAVLGIGINPTSGEADQPPAVSKADALRYVTGLDLGRELFANMEEVALFVVPGERRFDGLPIPDVGLVIAASDPERSRKLWEQLLSIPSIVMGPDVPQPTVRSVSGVEVQVFPMPEGVNIHVARLERSIIIAPTERAVAASIEASRSRTSILTDEGVKAAVDRLTPDTSLALFAHAGRCAQVASQFCPPHEVEHVRAVGALAGSTVVTLLADESPTRLRLAANVTGLPKAEDVIGMVSKMMAHHHPAGPPHVRPVQAAEPPAPIEADQADAQQREKKKSTIAVVH